MNNNNTDIDTYNNSLDYILFKDNSESSFNIFTVLSYLNNQNVNYLNPVGIVETNYPDEVINNLPSILLRNKNRYILGERKVLIFLAYHSNLDHNYITLKETALKQNQKQQKINSS